MSICTGSQIPMSDTEHLQYILTHKNNIAIQQTHFMGISQLMSVSRAGLEALCEKTCQNITNKKNINTAKRTQELIDRKGDNNFNVPSVPARQRRV